MINRDLLLTAAMFHDIGKVNELSDFPENDYTDDGQLLGHIVMGVEMIGSHIREIPGFPPVLASELKHCILAHHGEFVVGSFASRIHHETTAYDCFSWYRKTVSFDDHIRITTAYYNDIFAHGYFISFKIE